MCKIVNKSASCVRAPASQPGGFLVAVAAVTAAVLQGEAEHSGRQSKRLLRAWAAWADASTDLSAEQPLQESLLRRRRRLSSPVQVGRNRPVLVKDVELGEAARLDHLRGDRPCLRGLSGRGECLPPGRSPRSARGWTRSLWTLCCRRTRLWAPARRL